MVERFTVRDVSPVVECGTFPAKAAENEIIPFAATAFREGHDRIGVELTLMNPTGEIIGPFPMSNQSRSDRFEANFTTSHLGSWSFSIRVWSDPITTWQDRAEVKIPAGIDIDLELREGADLYEQVIGALDAIGAKTINRAVRAMRDTALSNSVRYAAATHAEVSKILTTHPIRENPCEYGPWPLLVERRRTLVGSWYEFFPRSEGATLQPLKSGTFASAEQLLPHIAEMGFDVVYIPPIHPIGVVNRKGPNNNLVSGPNDPGSPWAIGSVLGGHDSVNPDLGSLDDFVHFVRAAQDLNLEIALDLALQCSPDHPWVTSHPEWFTHRGDGSIAYAENPPKKYQDIYPLNFDNDADGLYDEIERIVLGWIDTGVHIFRVDNPHTKPVWFWRRLIGAINAQYPEVIFLAEAFTSEPMMRVLAQVGFQQSYTYFTWKNSKWELEEYLTELAGPKSAYMRPNLFTNTPDILSEYLQSGIPAAFEVRATLAAALSPTYGIYRGFEIYEHVALHPGSEDYLDSEKFQLRPRDKDFTRANDPHLVSYLTLLNQIRRANPALQELRTLRFHPSDSPEIIAFSKRGGINGADVILTVCNTDPENEHSTIVHWDMNELGLAWGDDFAVTDQISGTTWHWNEHTFIKLNPANEVAHIAKIISPLELLTVFNESHSTGIKVEKR